MKTEIEIADHEMPRAAVEARHYDDAWNALQANNPDLAAVRRKLSIHEIRCVIQALIGPLIVLRIENQKLRALLDFQGEPVEGPLDGVYSQYRDRIEALETALRGMLEAMAMGTIEIAAKYGPDAHPDEPLIDAAHKARSILENG